MIAIPMTWTRIKISLMRAIRDTRRAERAAGIREEDDVCAGDRSRHNISGSRVTASGDGAKDRWRAFWTRYNDAERRACARGADPKSLRIIFKAWKKAWSSMQ